MSKPIRWGRVALVYVAGALVCGGLYLAARGHVKPAAASSEPQLAVDAVQFDFGRVRPGAVLEHTFTVQNRGPGRIVLNRNDGCNCRDDDLAGSVIVPPGGQSPVPVTLAVSTRPGPQRRVATITTSDPRRPRLDFTLTAEVVEAR